MRRDTLFMIYRMYVRPILEFGYVRFSGSPQYKLRPLVMMEWQALRPCLGLLRYVPINVLYVKARIPQLRSRMHVLTVDAFIRVMASPVSRPQTAFVTWPSLFFSSPWPRFKRPQVIVVQSLLDPLHVVLLSVPVPNHSVSYLEVAFDEIFPTNAKLLPLSLLLGLFRDHLTGFPSHIIIATDASGLNDFFPPIT